MKMLSMQGLSVWTLATSCLATELQGSALLQRASMSFESSLSLEEGSNSRSLVSASEFVSRLADKVVGHDIPITAGERTALQTVESFIAGAFTTWKREHANDQTTINAIRDGIAKCAQTAKTSLANPIAGYEQQTSDSRTAHSACRTNQTGYYDTRKHHCDVYHSYRKGDGSMVPACIGQNIFKFTATDVSSDLLRMEACMVQTNDWINPLYDLYIKCKESETDETNVRNTCLQKQDAFESDFCYWSGELQAVCDQQDDCFVGEVATRTTVYDAMKVSEKARVADYKVGKKVLCLLDVLMNATNANKPVALTSCEGKSYDVSELVMTYPVVPAKEKCVPTADAPCEDSWGTREYTNQAWYAKAPATCSGQCAGYRPPAPSPSPTSKPTDWTGWDLIAKIPMGVRWHYDSPNWESPDTMSESSPPETIEREGAKYAKWASQQFDSFRFCIGTFKESCVTHKLPSVVPNAYTLFRGPPLRQSNLDQSAMLAAFGVEGFNKCPMQNPGINMKCTDTNSARIGFCSVCPDHACAGDGGDSDAAIGLGLTGQETGPMNAGYTDGFKSCQFDAKSYFNAWLWVKDSTR